MEEWVRTVIASAGSIIVGLVAAFKLRPEIDRLSIQNATELMHLLMEKVATLERRVAELEQENKILRSVLRPDT